MPECKEQWARTKRSRDRYATRLAEATIDVSTRQIPSSRRKSVRAWGTDANDFAIHCCQYLHHLKDWACHDPDLGITKEVAEQHVRDHPVLLVVSDICNGTKHAEVRAPRSSLAEPWHVAQRIRLSTGAADDHAAVAAEHTVRLDGKDVPLLSVIDDAIAAWDEFLSKRTTNADPTLGSAHEARTA